MTIAFRPLLETSLAEKKGLTFYLPGQTIAGIVVAVHDNGAVEVTNRSLGRLIIRLDQVAALGIA